MTVGCIMMTKKTFSLAICMSLGWKLSEIAGQFVIAQGVSGDQSQIV